jgi:hypothetical protein
MLQTNIILGRFQILKGEIIKQVGLTSDVTY